MHSIATPWPLLSRNPQVRAGGSTGKNSCRPPFVSS
jgi:hypothetical protein